MKTKEELNALKEEVESVNEKIRELTPEELEQVTGGVKHMKTMEGNHAAAHASYAYTDVAGGFVLTPSFP